MPETATDPLLLAAEQADAEAAAAEAEALAAQASATAARARARAAKLRREAGARTGGPAAGEVSAAGDEASSASAATAEADSDFPSGAEAPAASGETDPGAEVSGLGSEASAALGGTASTAAGASATAELPKGTGADSVDTGGAAQNPDVDGVGPRNPDVDGAGPRNSEGDGVGPRNPEGDAAGPQSGDAGGAARVGGEPESAAETGAEAAGGTGSAKMDSAEAGEDSTDRTTGTVAGRFSAAVRRVKPGAVRRPGRRTVARAVVAAIVLVSLVAGGLSMWNHHQLTADQAREDEYLNAAREGVIALTTLDSGRAGEDVRRVLDHSTGAFRTDFQTRSQDFTKVVEQSEVATQGEITAAAVESMTDESAVVLVSAVSRVTNSAGAQQEPRVWRLSVTVTREGSELKMSKVEFVP